ncbi:hypothetical protein [Paraburkholderia sp. J7]|uniref:hypothetical protein n=1 Tax=Paraburkholderia sp. J7 TaxID=2805438 RepID=UPI002AB61394|nr:hypothetical protein [Paraburkholderia sp. J7]
MSEATAIPGSMPGALPGSAPGPIPARGPVRARAPARSRSMSRFLIGPFATPMAMFLLTFALILAHQGRLLEMTFMPMGCAVAYWLYRRYPAHYLSYVCWLFFLTPEVRRFADFFNGAFNSTSMIMMTPFVAASLCGISMVLNYRLLGQRRAAPLIMLLIAVAYGYVLGVAQFGIVPATYTMVGWVQPIFIGWYIMLNWRLYPLFRQVLFKTFVWGTILMGFYGIYQYVSPPPWTIFWLAQSGMESSSGSPVPFGMRICSTMNSAGPFSMTMMVGLLMSIASPSKLKIAAGIAGVPALLFTAVRTSWGAVVIGLIYPLAMLDVRSRLRLIMAILLFAGLCTPMLLIDQVTAPLAKRMATIGNLSEDNSFQARQGFYTNFASIAEESFAGHGLGSTGLAAKLADPHAQIIASLDSGVVDIVWVLGWGGGLLYVAGLVALLWRAFLASLARPGDRFAISVVGVAIAILAIMVMIDTMQGSSGMYFMFGVVMPVIGVRYSRQQQRRNEAIARARRRGLA